MYILYTNLIDIQTQADLISIRVRRPQMRETTALGAAVAAARAAGLAWEDTTAAAARETVFEPAIGREESEVLFERWERAVKLCGGWVDDSFDSSSSSS